MSLEPVPVTLETYLAALQSHDWYFAFSDDHSVYLGGLESERRLLAMARELDPDRAIMRQHMPDGA